MRTIRDDIKPNDSEREFLTRWLGSNFINTWIDDPYRDIAKLCLKVERIQYPDLLASKEFPGWVSYLGIKVFQYEDIIWARRSGQPDSYWFRNEDLKKIENL